MANKKRAPKKSVPEKTIMAKIAGKVGHLAGELVAGKDHLVGMAGDAIESVKSTIQNIAVKKKSVPNKAVKAKTKKAVTKQILASAKKSGTPAPAAVKKAAPPKKAIKKAIKKVAKKVTEKK